MNITAVLVVLIISLTFFPLLATTKESTTVASIDSIDSIDDDLDDDLDDDTLDLSIVTEDELEES